MKFHVLSFLIIFIISSLDLSATSSEQQTNYDQKSNTEAQQKTQEFNKDANKDTKEQEAKDKDKDSKDKNKVEDREKAPEPEKLLKIGNLAFPVSQQPSPLISFGQNLLNKKQAQALFLTTEFKGEHEYFINMVPSILYGIRDDLSIFISMPIAVRYRQEHHHSSGPEDLIIQLEYSPWTGEYYTYYDQITLVGNVTIPTGSTKKNPNTGTGSNSFFIGGIYSRMAINWFYFTSYGGVLNASSHRTRFGNQFLYQYGVGRRICSNKNWLFAWMVEFDGLYFERNKIHGKTNHDSGGNIISVTPSLFIASKESLIVQLGIGFPIYQHLFGHQSKKEYMLALNLEWTF